MADVDDLTGLPARGAFLRALADEVALAGVRQQPLCLLLIDLDYLKSINDHYGHQAGDAALRAVAGILRCGLRGDDLAGRYGGDEFLILLPCTPLTAGMAVAERLLAAVTDTPCPLPDRRVDLRLSLSIGVAAFPDDGQDGNALLAGADRGAYAAKAAGRGAVRRALRTTEAPDSEGPCPVTIRGGRMVGREAELGRLRAYLEDAGRGHGGVVLLEGEAGIGKTRLAEELASLGKLLGMRVIWARCHQLENAAPYLPFLEGLAPLIATLPGETLARAAGAWAGEVARLLPALQRRLASAVPLPPLPPEEDRMRLQQALCQLLIGLAETPVLLLLDDVQWADEASVRVLNHLGWQVDGVPMLIACTVRSEELSANAGLEQALMLLERHRRLRERITLRRLTGAESATLLRLATGLRWPPDALQQRVIDDTNGNPLFLLETVRLLIEQQILCEDHGRWRVRPEAALAAGLERGYLPVAPSVGGVIGARLARISETGRAVLDIAAVIGNGFAPEMVVTVAVQAGSAVHMPEETAWAALEWIERLRILQPAGADGCSYEFTHPLIRQVAYLQVSPVRRRRLHRHVARALAADGAAPGVVAEHYWRGGEPETALDHLIRAAEHAAAVHAVSTAIGHYERALEAVAALAPQAREARHAQVPAVWEALGALRDLRGEWQGACDAYRQAIGLATGDRHRLATLWCKLGDLCVRRGEHAQARAAYEAAGGEDESELAPPVQATLLLGHASLCLDQTAYAQATALATAALALLEQHGPAEPELMSKATRLLGTCALQGGRLDAAAHWFQRGLAESEAAGHLDGVAYFRGRLATLDFRRGDLDRAEEGYRQALALGERIGSQRTVSACQGNLGVIADTRGRHDEAREWYQRAVQTFERMGDRHGISASYHNLGLAAKIAGEYQTFGDSGEDGVG